MVSGSLSNRVGKRKIFIIAGYGLSTITKRFFAASTQLIDALVVRFGDRMGKEKVLIIGYLLFVVSTALMLLISANAFYTYMMAAIFGLYIGISETF
jgi:Na+/melibiose symporter-like transporter